MELALFLTPWKKWKFCVDRRMKKLLHYKDFDDANNVSGYLK